ncbi:MAG: DUF5667 domain-containing protein [Dehalococcoidia bacterium]
MTDRLEEIFSDCLESLSSGRRTLAQCLAAYPEEAARLEPLLTTALRVDDALSAEPRPEFVAAARQRFLRVTAQSLTESFRTEPRPSFVAATRKRFLEAAQQMVSTGKSRAWRLPSFLRPSLSPRPLAASICVLFLMAFTGFGSIVVVSAGDAVPGDWRYPVKRATEEVRLKLAFGEGARRGVKVDLARERLYEIKTLTAEGHPISDSLLSDLEDNTNSVVKSLDSSGWKAEDAVQVADLAKQQQQALASAAPLVEPQAQDELAEAQATSNEALMSALVYAGGGEAAAEPSATPTLAATPTTAVTATPEGEAPTAAATTEPGGATTEPSPVPPTPTAIEVTPVPGHAVRVPVPGEDAGLSWDLVVIDRFSVEVPSEDSGWRLDGLDFGGGTIVVAPSLLRIVSADNMAIIVINPRNGDTYWYQYKDGFFQELVVRAAAGVIEWQADDDAIRAFDPANADVVLHIANSIEIAPPPTPTPTPTETTAPQVTPTLTANSGPSDSSTPIP